MHPLVTEAMKKAAVAWLGGMNRPDYAVWCLWVDDALYVISGPDEQPAPGLATAATVIVTARGDHGGRIVSWLARVEHIEPDTDGWTAVAAQLAAKRLNSATSDELVERCARQCVLSRLVPTEEALVDLPDASLAAPPSPTPATRSPRAPLRPHRVRKRRH